MELFGEEIIEPKKREPVNLANHNEKEYIESIKANELDIYENEYHLIEQTLNLPKKFMELSEIEKSMVLLFVDKDYIEPHSGKHTENSSFISFLASYHNQDVVKRLYIEKEKTIGYDKQGNKIVETYKIIDPKELALYQKLKKHAIALWTTNNLREISKSMREIVTNNGFRDNELLEQKIVSDAMSDKRDSFTMQNRRVAVEIKGMKKPQGLQQINVFLDGGGKQASKEIAKTTKNKAFDIIPGEFEEVE